MDPLIYSLNSLLFHGLACNRPGSVIFQQRKAKLVCREADDCVTGCQALVPLDAGLLY